MCICEWYYVYCINVSQSCRSRSIDVFKGSNTFVCVSERFISVLKTIFQVQDNHIAKATLGIVEQKGNGKFNIETEISGRVSVEFTNIRDNNSFIMVADEDIYVILEDHVNEEIKNGRQMVLFDLTKKRELFISQQPEIFNSNMASDRK